jgi:hypothetical protein
VISEQELAAVAAALACLEPDRSDVPAEPVSRWKLAARQSSIQGDPSGFAGWGRGSAQRWSAFEIHGVPKAHRALGNDLRAF